MLDNTALFAITIVLLPMFYLLLAAPAFLLVRLNVTPVARLLRGMFNSYFIVLALAGAVGLVAVATAGRLGLVVCFALLTALAMASRHLFLQRAQFGIDQDTIDDEIARRLRRLHWSGMLSNAALLAAVLLCIPYLVTPA
jgi:hypothetical protein